MNTLGEDAQKSPSRLHASPSCAKRSCEVKHLHFGLHSPAPFETFHVMSEDCSSIFALAQVCSRGALPVCCKSTTPDTVVQDRASTDRDASNLHLPCALVRSEEKIHQSLSKALCLQRPCGQDRKVIVAVEALLENGALSSQLETREKKDAKSRRQSRPVPMDRHRSTGEKP